MTLGDGKRKVLMLLDEYSSGGEITVDEDLQNKMADFFDIAQKEMAGYKKIVRNTMLTLEASGGSGWTLLELPEDFGDIFRIWEDGRMISRFPVVDGKLAVPAKKSGSIVLEYFARPKTINKDTPDTYEFEVTEEAANCLPFFVAAQHLLPDLVVDYSAFWNTYLTMRAALDMSLPSGGGGGVRQALYRR